VNWGWTIWTVLAIIVAGRVIPALFKSGEGVPMEWRYSDGGRAEAGYRGKTGDCVTRALAIATDTPYQEVYQTVNEFAKAERRRSPGTSSAREGVFPATMSRLMVHYGGIWVPTMGIGTGVKVHMREGELPPGILIARLSKHVTAVIDGVAYDNHDPRRGGNRAVYGYWAFPRESE
jgi:hypothetical protein